MVNNDDVPEEHYTLPLLCNGNKICWFSKEEHKLKTMESSNIDILFLGTRCFWRTKCTLFIALIEHTQFNIIEIVAFDFTSSAEAPRIYINPSALPQKLFNLNKKLADFIVGHMVLHREDISAKSVGVELRFPAEREIDLESLICSVPDGVLPYSLE